jgi:hypothetical protein
VLKARNKKISLLIVLAMLMTMFVGVGTASAATTITSLSAPLIPTDSVPGTHNLGTVEVAISNVKAIPTDGVWLTVSLPKGCEYNSGLVYDFSDNLYVVDIQTAVDVVELQIFNDYSGTGDVNGDITLYFEDISVKSGSGEIAAKFLSNSTIIGQLNTAKIAVIGEGGTTVIAKSEKTIGDAGGEIDTIVIAESIGGVFKNGETITLKLPKGFAWNADNVTGVFPGAVMGAWSMLGLAFQATIDADNPRIMTVVVNDDIAVAPTGAVVPTLSAGRVNIGSETAGYFAIDVNDTAKFGDIYVTVESNMDSVKKTDVKVAVYGDYGVKVVEGTKEEVLAGRQEQEVGKFYIQEQIEGSLVAGRSMYFELPKGAKWQLDENNEPVITMISEEGTSITNVSCSVVQNTSQRKLRVRFDFGGANFSSEAAKIVVKDMEVRVEPTFEGDITVAVSGNAGAVGEAVIANAIKPITLKAENTTKVEIGAMNQKAADILIVENVDGAILDEQIDDTILADVYDEFGPQIIVTLPKGVEFYKDPVVKVEEGDLEIDTVDYYDGYLVIKIDSSSSKKSTIRISDVFLTVDRTVPEGDVKAKFPGHEVESNRIVGTGCTAFVNWATEESCGDVVIATTITPKQGGHAKFVIGSNIYEIGAVPYVMDAVPYVKNSRSYVPMRYLALMLGAEIVWSEADQSITLTKEGETTVVLTIGSTTYTVNGESKTMDVAPEIVNDRSFLPARFVAEAFGAQVGWDAATQTVIIVR